MQSFIRDKYKNLSVAPIYFTLTRRSIDARAGKVKVNIWGDISTEEILEPAYSIKKTYRDVSKSKQVVITGSGPAGLFAALRFLELGIKPVILERGKDVRSRRRDIAAINKAHTVDPDSNYCFGEGGAGTYSDGKLYTRSIKRGNPRRILELFIAHGAHPEILVDTHPHIGTNKLPNIVMNIRENILGAGGEIHFNTRVTDFVLEGDEMKGVIDQDGGLYQGEAFILATGHSARDIFQLLKKKGIVISFKDFALGVRIEHPQSLIDSIQYHCDRRGAYLPAASYSLVTQVQYQGVEKGVFSFCMCPGGFIVPAATAPGEIVVNGMSPSRRDSRFANSGMVVTVGEADLQNFNHHGVLAGLEFQKSIEQKACLLAGGSQAAPAQRLMDFVQKRISSTLPDTSYQPGIVTSDLDAIFPEIIAGSLREGLKRFGKNMKGYLTNEAVLVGVESRTSSPVRIPRNINTLEHEQVRRLFPAGEGAGYAGGIVSAAMDGEKCAEMIYQMYFNKT